jgi:hypothetical protein
MRLSFGKVAVAGLLFAVVACDSPTKPRAAVANVVVGPGLAIVDAGGTVQFGVNVTDANGRRLEGREVTWSTEDAAVAGVSATGLVTGSPNPTTGERSTFVRATVEGIQAQASVAVRPSVVATLDITPLVGVLSDGDAPTLVVEARDAAGNLLPGRPVSWQSRDASTAQVSAAGVLTPVAFLDAGNRNVRIVANVGLVYDSITVAVAPTELSEIGIFPQAPYMQPGWTKTLRVEGRTPSDNIVLGLTPTYSSSNPAVATVSAGGVVTSFAGVTGSTNIIATFGAFADTVPLFVDACGAGPSGTYPLEVRFYGPNPPSPSVEAAFTCAANRIRAIVRLPISGVNIANPNMNGCTGEATVVNETNMQGLIIYAKVDSIDGPGQVLGSAGPCFVRSTSRLPVIGVMRFDNADLANLEADGRLLSVIMHEMLHVIGIGTTWRETTLNMWTGDVANPGFLGLAARAACVNDHGGATTCTTHVPIEDCVGIPGCGAGTRLGHWRELIFRTELMTGYVSAAGVRNPFSKMTIQALGDLGYTVDADQSNDYVIPPAALMGIRQQSSSAGDLRMPAPRLPTHEIDRSGRIRPLLR